VLVENRVQGPQQRKRGIQAQTMSGDACLEASKEKKTSSPRSKDEGEEGGANQVRRGMMTLERPGGAVSRRQELEAEVQGQKSYLRCENACAPREGA